MKLYMVKTDRDRSLITESKKQALKDFEREIDYIGTWNIETKMHSEK